MVHAFGECELDEALFQLRRRGKVVKIEPKVFNVLAYLLRHRDRVVPKDELLDALWPAQAVSESVLPKCVAAARRAVGDGRTRAHVIQTVHGRGYRFVADVHDAAHAAGYRTGPVTDSRPRSPFVGRDAAMQRLRGGLDAGVSPDTDTCSCSSASPASARRAPRKSSPPRHHRRRASSSGAPTKAKAHPHSGRGCRSCVPASGRRSADAPAT